MVICRICKKLNPMENTRCIKCWSILIDSEPLSADRVLQIEKEIQRNVNRARIRRFAISSVLMAALITILAVFIYSNVVSQFIHQEFELSTPVTSEFSVLDDPWVTPEGILAWEFLSSSPIKSSPVADDGVLYISAGSAGILALDARLGSLLWQRDGFGPVDSDPVVHEGLIYVALKDGRIVALETQDGKIAWIFQTGGSVLSGPVLYRGVLYVGSGDRKLYALDALNGEKLWTYKTRSWILSTPVVNENVVAVISRDRYLYILDRKTGRQRLDYGLGSSNSSPVLWDYSIFGVTRNGWIKSIDWTAKDRLFEKFRQRLRHNLLVWGLIDSIPEQSGHIWSHMEPTMEFSSGPVVSMDNIVIASESGHLLAVSMIDGHTQWTFDAGVPLLSSPFSKKAILYLADSAGNIYHLDSSTGRSKREFSVSSRVTTTPLLHQGMLYVTAWDGKIYAFE